MEKITLSHPIEWNGTKVTALSMRRPKVRDMIAADKLKGSDAEKEVLAFANLCEVEKEVIQELDMQDYTNLQNTYRGFIVLKSDDVRQICMKLAEFTGWALDDLLNLDGDELFAWLETLGKIQPRSP